MRVLWETFPSSVLLDEWSIDDDYVGPLSVLVAVDAFRLDLSDELVATTQQAALAANADMGWPSSPTDQWGVDWTEVCETPVGVMVLVEDAFDPPTLRDWVAHLASRLDIAGVAGQLGGAKRWITLRPQPDPAGWWPGLATLYYELSRHVLDEQGRAPFLEAGPADAAHVVRTALDWLGPGVAQVRVDPQYDQGAIDCSTDLAGEYLLRHLTVWKNRLFSIRFTSTPTRPLRDLRSSPNGEVWFDCLPDPDDWTSRVDECVRLFRREAPHVDLAIAPHVYDVVGRPARHLLRQYLVAPSGIMLLRDAHLEKASRLDDWVVEPVGDACWLVSSRHLDAWFTGSGPDPEAVAQARHDFHDAMITVELAREDLPYLP